MERNGKGSRGRIHSGWGCGLWCSFLSFKEKIRSKSRFFFGDPCWCCIPCTCNGGGSRVPGMLFWTWSQICWPPAEVVDAHCLSFSPGLVLWKELLLEKQVPKQNKGTVRESFHSELKQNKNPFYYEHDSLGPHTLISYLPLGYFKSVKAQGHLIFGNSILSTSHILKWTCIPQQIECLLQWNWREWLYFL